ncbi:MAG: hypothetical protein KAI17_12435, partial [Thiotrichaceae bacterium]|nr:hypothetical protein [Thiotrichaceae bacterium]
MIFFSLLAVVFLSPLPYATNRPWSWSLWALLIALITICWCIHTLFKQLSVDHYHPLKPIKGLALVFFLVILWAFIQITSIIPADWGHPLWNMTENILQRDVSTSISLNRADSITSIMRLVSYALVFLLSFYYCHDRDKAKNIFAGMMISGFLYSIYGLIIHLGGFKTILWQENWYGDALTSTFVNRNHFASYAGLTLICSLALLSDGVQSSSKYKLGGYLGWQRFIENLINRNWFP